MNLFGVQSHLYKKKIGGDSIDLFLVFQVERKTVMTIGKELTIPRSFGGNSSEPTSFGEAAGYDT